MQHVRDINTLQLSGCGLTIGAFDGVHVGHQALVGAMVSDARARNLPAVVLTFYPHPSVVLHGRSPSFYITLPDGTRIDLNSGMYLIIWKVKVGNQTFYTTDPYDRMESITDNSTGQIDYENPIAVISYAGRKFYSYQSDSLEGNRYLFAIRVEDVNGVEDDSLAELVIQVATLSPNSIDTLSAKTI